MYSLLSTACTRALPVKYKGIMGCNVQHPRVTEEVQIKAVVGDTGLVRAGEEVDKAKHVASMEDRDGWSIAIFGPIYSIRF